MAHDGGHKAMIYLIFITCLCACVRPIPEQVDAQLCPTKQQASICPSPPSQCPVESSLQEWVESYDIWENGHTDQPI